MSFDAITFDLDGTLVDTAGEIAGSVNAALAEHGIAVRSTEEITHLIGNGLRELTIRLLARILLEQPALADRVRVDEVLARTERHYAASVGRHARPYPGALQALRALRADGVATACVTNKDGRYTRQLLEATGLIEQIDLVIAGDTLPHKKPHGSVLRTAATRLQVATDRLAHVGDSATDLEAARQAGVTGWAVPYGYNGGVAIELAHPTRVFDDLVQVAAHVLTLRQRERATAA
jgi:phosphoglycolate phosphatase